MDARKRLSSAVWMALLLALVLVLAACGGAQRSLSQLEQPLDGGDTSAGEGQASEGEGSSESAEGDESSEEEMGNVALSCPKGPVPVKLAIAHQYNYSPNRMTEKYSVNATTDPNAWCMITLAGSRVTAEPCSFSYHYEGFTTDGTTVCQIAGDGTAGLEITGRCEKGRLILQLSEYADDRGLTGKLNCPGVATIEYGTAYPPTLTEAIFVISSEGSTVTDFADRDVTSQFSYNKTWTLIVPPDVVGGP
jgi:hypothetical protein